MPVGTGATLSFSGLTAKIIDINWDGFEITTYDDSTLDTVAWTLKEANALANAKPITATVKYKSTLVMPAPRE